MIEDRTFYVEYESLDNICFSCGFYGHKADTCKSEESPGPEATQAEQVNHPVDTSKPEGDTGEWMTVQRRNRGKMAKTSSLHQRHLTMDQDLMCSCMTNL
ncbi:hypothetical protein LINPERHAP2_LOCUS39906 [Linum perenne]